MIAQNAVSRAAVIISHGVVRVEFYGFGAVRDCLLKISQDAVGIAAPAINLCRRINFN